jgi:hypothetical protein
MEIISSDEDIEFGGIEEEQQRQPRQVGFSKLVIMF